MRYSIYVSVGVDKWAINHIFFISSIKHSSHQVSHDTCLNKRWEFTSEHFKMRESIVILKLFLNLGMFHLLNTLVRLGNIPCMLNIMMSSYCQFMVMSHRIYTPRYPMHSLDFMFWNCIGKKCRKEKPDHQSRFVSLRSLWSIHCCEFHYINQIFIT